MCRAARSSSWLTYIRTTPLADAPLPTRWNTTNHRSAPPELGTSTSTAPRAFQHRFLSFPRGAATVPERRVASRWLVPVRAVLASPSTTAKLRDVSSVPAAVVAGKPDRVTAADATVEMACSRDGQAAESCLQRWLGPPAGISRRATSSAAGQDRPRCPGQLPCRSALDRCRPDVAPETHAARRHGTSAGLRSVPPRRSV